MNLCKLKLSRPRTQRATWWNFHCLIFANLMLQNNQITWAFHTCRKCCPCSILLTGDCSWSIDYVASCTSKCSSSTWDSLFAELTDTSINWWWPGMTTLLWSKNDKKAGIFFMSSRAFWISDTALVICF